MADEIKNRIDALELLRKSAMERYEWRAQVEWKLCLALWTAFAAFIAAVLTGKDPASLKMPAVFVVAIVALTVCGLHWWWLSGLRRAQHLDNRISFFFRDTMMAEVGIAFPPQTDNEPGILKEIDNVRGKDQGVWRHWSHGFQLWVTILLAFGAIGAVASVWWSANHAENRKADPQVISPFSNKAAKP